MKYNFKSLKKEIAEKKIELGYNNGKLTYEIKEEQFTDELFEAIKKYKSQLIKYYCPLKDRSNLMPLNKKGSKIPFFLINGENANYFLKETLGPDQPFYGFLHLGSDGEEIPFTNLHIMAQSYMQQLLKQQPNGPFILGGFSFGGIVAFEVANLLQAKGYKVPLVVLFDTKNTNKKEPYVWGKNPYRILRSNILSPLYYNFLDFKRISICNTYVRLNKPIPVKLRNKYILYKYRQLSKNYNPDKYDGKILLYRADETASVYKYLGWRDFTDNIELVSVRGNHEQFLSNPESIEIIKKTIKESFDKIQN